MKQKLLLIIPLLLLLFNACKPEVRCIDGNSYKYIDEYDYSKIPFKDHSVLTFIDKKLKILWFLQAKAFNTDLANM
jgi:hypothetical protein